MRARLALSFALAVVVAVAPGAAGAGTPQCYTNWRGAREVNVQAQFGTDDRAIRAAIDLATAERCGLYFQSGTYTYGSALTLDGIAAYGDGPASVLTATDPSLSAIQLVGNGPRLMNVEVTSPNATARGDTWESAAVLIKSATNFVVDHVVVDRASGAGIFNFGGAYGQITTNTVRNTLADAIHNAHGAHHLDIAFNDVASSGDDMFSVVSYGFDGSPCHDIAVHDNIGRGQAWGRGVAVVGGYAIQLVRNTVEHTHGAGVYIASEPLYQTFGVDGVVVSQNVVGYPDEGRVHDASILVWGGRAGFPVRNVSGSGNVVDRSRQGLRVLGATSGISIGWAYAAS